MRALLVATVAIAVAIILASAAPYEDEEEDGGATMGEDTSEDDDEEGGDDQARGEGPRTSPRLQPVGHRVDEVGDRHADDEGQQNTAQQVKQQGEGRETGRPQHDARFPGQSRFSMAAARRLHVTT